MKTILLRPIDVLFFGNGQPLTGSVANLTLSWPLPSVMNTAFHAALHRAGFAATQHPHRGSKDPQVRLRGRRFGSVQTAGPFPVRDGDHSWFFSRPADAQVRGTVEPSLWPAARARGRSNLPSFLPYAIGSHSPPSKTKPEPWISGRAFAEYLAGGAGSVAADELLEHRHLADTEHQIGIAIDATSQTTGHDAAEGLIYPAHFLRLQEGWRLGVCAEAQDGPDDWIASLLNPPGRLVVGGQQRICSAELESPPALPLPQGQTRGFRFREGKCLVKWVLLSPAIWPEIEDRPKNGRPIQPHPGGWLPNWVYARWDAQARQILNHPDNGRVLLRTLHDGERRSRRQRKKGGDGIDGDANSSPIRARLVAAVVPKPIVVTGWALGDRTASEDPSAPGALTAWGRPGAKSTHLAVPAGAVYYFEVEGETPEIAAKEAEILASALNWHRGEECGAIANRRSTLAGEKGFGLGVCGTWNRFDTAASRGRPEPALARID